jgi:guanylate kinase
LNSSVNNKLVLFCGPSGSGKTSIVRHLLKVIPQLSFSISATTRPRRSNEQNGEDYYFVSVEEFHDKIKNDEFLEWEEVYTNGFYGTLKSEIERISSMGKVAIFDVDVEGGVHIKGRYAEQLLDVFVRPPAVEDLRARLIGRASETPETLERRILKAELEMTYSDRFSHVIINRDLDLAMKEAEKLVRGFLAS